MNFKKYVVLLRVHQYVKNLMIFAPLFFAERIMDPQLFIYSLKAFLGFSFLASSVYVYNDYVDVVSDKKHPEKKNRPYASGEVNNIGCIISFIICLIMGLTILYTIRIEILLPSIFYLTLNFIYSKKLKNIPILDIICISIGFVIRIFIGGIATQIDLSNWIIIITFLLALFLALSKRRDDLIIYQNVGTTARQVINGYNIEYINAMMAMTGSLTILSYIMYTITPTIINQVGDESLYISSIFVLAGIMRYLQITIVFNNSGSPTRIFMKDRFIQASLGLWILYLYLVIYIN